MARIIIDLRDDENMWSGDIGLRVQNGSSFDGQDEAIVVGETEIVVSVRQLITLHEVLDEWLHASNPTEIGGIKKRMVEAIHMVLEEDHLTVERAIKNKSLGTIADRIADAFKMKGLLPRLRVEA